VGRIGLPKVSGGDVARDGGILAQYGDGNALDGESTDMAIRWNNRVALRALAIGCALVLLIGMAMPAIPPNVTQTTTASFCQKCGMCETVTEVRSFSDGWAPHRDAQQTPTALSAWYEAHYRAPCQHVWRMSHSCGSGHLVLGPFRMSTGPRFWSSGPNPALLWLNDAQRADLDQRFAADEAACRQYIAAELNPFRDRGSGDTE
jgi:hypothetical protein